MKNNRRSRIYVLIMVMTLGLLPGLLAFLSTTVGISPRDPQFLGADYKAQFIATKSLADQSPIEVRSEGRSKLIISEGGQVSEFTFSPEGSYIKDGRDTGAYPVFWVRFPPQDKMRLRGEFTKQINNLKVVDLTGLLGPKGNIYRVKNETSTILWSWVLGSQFSHPLKFIDDNGAVVASGIYDTTCGIMEELSVYKDGALGEISLVETTFPMSRNRNFFLLYSVFVSAAILLYHFIRRRKKTTDPGMFSLETDMLILGMIAMYVDVYLDIWFFHVTGPWLLVAIHLAASGYVYWRFRLWVIFPLLELFWAGALALASRSIIPQLAFAPVLIIVWFALLEFMPLHKKYGIGETKQEEAA